MWRVIRSNIAVGGTNNLPGSVLIDDYIDDATSIARRIDIPSVYENT